MPPVSSLLLQLLLLFPVLPYDSATLPTRVGATDSLGLCTRSSLPSDIQARLKTDFSSWKIQESANLSDYTRKTWNGRKPLVCPGIAVGLFQVPTAPSYAFLLVPVNERRVGYRFLVFSPKVGASSYETTVVEQSDDHGASSYFIRKVPVNEFFSEQSKKKFQVQATDCILMVDSAEQEYETDVYFWSNGRFRQEPVDN